MAEYEILTSLLDLNIEELRKEFCLMEYPSMKKRVIRINEKFRKINSMMDDQLVAHKTWHKDADEKKDVTQ